MQDTKTAKSPRQIASKTAIFVITCITVCSLISLLPADSIAFANETGKTANVQVKSSSKAQSSGKTKQYKKVVAIDPGHAARLARGTDPIAPGSTRRKAKITSGTAGRYTHVPEYKVTMNVANKLKKLLENRGYRVILTRKTNKAVIGNKARAEIANRHKADIYVRLHCDGVGNSSANGISMQNPGKHYQRPRKNFSKSAKLARCILKYTCKATGAKSKGIYYRNDLTGNNWAKMPVTLIEMGFMTNPVEDHRLVRNSYQKRLARGIADGIDRYFGYKLKS